MIWLFAVLGIVVVVVIGLVVLGRETARLATSTRPSVFDLTQAVEFIADRLPTSSQARLTHDDVRWILLADADLLEEATADLEPDDDPDEAETEVVDDEAAIARLLALADESGRDLADEDVVAVLDGRMAYLGAIGAIGPEA